MKNKFKHLKPFENYEQMDNKSTIINENELYSKSKSETLKELLEEVYIAGQDSASTGDNYVISFDEYYEENEMKFLNSSIMMGNW